MKLILHQFDRLLLFLSPCVCYLCLFYVGIAVPTRLPGKNVILDSVIHDMSPLICQLRHLSFVTKTKKRSKYESRD